MNVFVLCTGRCGSLTFAKACGHITNYTTGHETRANRIAGRLTYPHRHIEVDNRLSWFTGTLFKWYPDALYIHLKRDYEQVANSYAQRFGVTGGIMSAFSSGILRRGRARVQERKDLARFYTRTVNDNIEQALQGRNHITIHIEDPHPGFEEMWGRIGAEGDLEAAKAELKRVHNARKHRD